MSFQYLVYRTTNILDGNVSGFHRHYAATATALVNRNTSGIDSWLTTPTMIVLASSWIGSSSPRVVSADATRILSSDKSLLNVFILFQQ